MAPRRVVYALQFVERVLEAAGGINGLAAAGYQHAPPCRAVVCQ